MRKVIGIGLMCFGMFWMSLGVGLDENLPSSILARCGVPFPINFAISYAVSLSMIGVIAGAFWMMRRQATEESQCE